MNRIITISREFGSGGRELGKRLAEALHIPCYDHEIIEMIAKENGFNEDYVAHVSEKSIEAAYPLTIGHRFGVTPLPDHGPAHPRGRDPAEDLGELRQERRLRHRGPRR